MRILTIRASELVTGAALNRAIRQATKEAIITPTAYTVVCGFDRDGAVSDRIADDIITVKCATRRYEEAW